MERRAIYNFESSVTMKTQNDEFVGSLGSIYYIQNTKDRLLSVTRLLQYDIKPFYGSRMGSMCKETFNSVVPDTPIAEGIARIVAYQVNGVTRPNNTLIMEPNVEIHPVIIQKLTFAGYV